MAERDPKSAVQFKADESLAEYEGIVGTLANRMSAPGASSEPIVVAEVICKAVIAGTNCLRSTAGDDARESLVKPTAFGDEEFLVGMKAQFGVGTT